MADRRAAIALLPGRYGFALFLREEGLSDTEIGTRLGLDPSATANLLALAEAKLTTQIELTAKLESHESD